MRPIVKFILTDGMNTEGQLYRVTKNCSVRFVPDVSLIGKHVRFFINYPEVNKLKFDRLAYRELRLVNPTLSKNTVDCFDDYFELSPLPISGAFHFCFTTDGNVPSMNGDPGPSLVAGSGYLTIDPHFVTKHEQEASESITEHGWNLDGLVIQTVLPKNLGYFNEWESRLMSAKEGKYNMIHFTPLQELGYSRSAYSLRDQLKVNPEFTHPGAVKPVDWSDIENFLKHLENDWSVLCMADLVFNHTSNDSPWIHQHPECAYNVVNSPHLVPAYLLDTIVWQLTVQVANKQLEHIGLYPNLSNPGHEIGAMRKWLNEQITEARLDEFFLADVAAIQEEFTTWLLSSTEDPSDWSTLSNHDELKLSIGGKRQGRRFGSTVDFRLARKLFVGVTDHSMPLNQASAEAAAKRLRERLEELNAAKRNEVADHLRAAVDNVMANAHYRFYDPHGLKLGVVTVDSPIMWSYFYQPAKNVNCVKDAEAVLSTADASRVMAFNGWVINDNPMRNFAEADSHVYLRRELVVWGDSVKLRYGQKPADCPYLWDRMARYAELTARMFHAVRLDNCHSTPLVVAQYMLDRARAVRPNLYIVAELFTNSEYQDNVFMNKLGLNSLIRESLQAHDPHALGGNLYRYGVTRPAGAFFTHIVPRRLYPSVAHALLYDQTHDNPSVAEKHCSFDYLPLAALNAITCCAIGSTRGYDDLVPHHIDVVKEERPFAKWPEQINMQTGLVQLKSILNELHQWLSAQGFTEMFVDQCSTNVIALTRICPETRESVVLVAHTAFNIDVVHRGHVNFKSIELGGHVHRLLLEAQTNWKHGAKEFKKNPTYINGLENLSFTLSQNVDPMQSKMFNVERSSGKGESLPDRLHFHNFPPGSIVVLSVCLTEQQESALGRLHSSLKDQFSCSLHKSRVSIQMGHGEKAYTAHALAHRGSVVEPNCLRMLLSDLKLLDLNRILYRCEAEAWAEEPSSGVYDIPGFGKLCYAGFQAIAALLEDIRDKNDLGHPICDHLRHGDWLADFLCNRLCQRPKNSEEILSEGLVSVGRTLGMLFAPLRQLPRYLVPAYFETMIHLLQNLLSQESILRMSPWIMSSSSVIKRLALATNQFFGFIGNCKLPSPTPLLPLDVTAPPGPFTGGGPMYCSLAAGLPHFAEGMWRCWGRDTFIAFRGCLLLTGRFEEAAAVILSYASLVRHGLIPNLTGEGNNVQPRYNCRDAVWFWLYAIICYEQSVVQNSHTEGKTSTGTLLNRNVWRWFMSDDSEGWPQEKPERRVSQITSRLQPLHDTIQEVLQRHLTGIDFVERNAGPQLDEQMKPEGFHVTARVNPHTGFPEGGNAFNCGTWMDKMGSSERAGNRGIPATPRDGAAVELVGLAYAVTKWLDKAHKQTDNAGNPLYPHTGVQLPNGKFYTWDDWANRLKESFEPAFWIPSDTQDPALMYNRGIYRDTVGSSAGYTDNQLRPNFLVAMVVAPDLFSPERAWNALELARIHLVGPYGMRTLGTNDLAYRGDYRNDQDTTDYATSKGFNYHQGPEWLWPTGYYLRARLLFARLLAKSDPQYEYLAPMAVAECQNTLARLDKAILSTAWRSLPELTNSNGQFCRDSCAAQAWSVGCALEAAYDLTNPSAD